MAKDRRVTIRISDDTWDRLQDVTRITETVSDVIRKGLMRMIEEREG